MQRLTARYADMWNTCWLGPARNLVPRQAEMLVACTQEGRDPATLATTVAVNVFFTTPDTVLPASVNPERTIIGSSEQVATVFHDYEALGVKHLICALNPDNSSALEHLSSALHMYRLMEKQRQEK
jgi:alkanesulfonate monooxygenase SsuD/methylene tetrahydromethanopterin reductase-like flavin-dependent oxidoreductase (luciferase family)